ncbi:MAG: hypothetical protein OIF32_04130 [Campylobacterales bacterium]|nr:hypothetical protein [Campylobacterales bacterium]
MKKLILSVATAVTIVSISGCGSDSDSEKKNDTSNETSFNTSAKNAVRNSIMDLPSSITENHTTASASSRSANPDRGYANYYTAIKAYVDIAEVMKDAVRDILTGVITNLGNIPESSYNSITKISDDTSEANEITHIKLEKNPTGANEDYQWKVTFFMDGDTTSPSIIVRFTIVGDEAKGRLLSSFTSQNNVSKTDTTANMDVLFDGTTSPKTLSIKLTQDLSSVFSYGKANWSTLTDVQKSELDLGQPAKMAITARYNDSTKEFDIYGTSYHPGWDLQATLKSEENFWGDDNRTIYSFKVKSRDDDTLKGSKVVLALPTADTGTIDSNYWNENSVGALFVKAITKDINEFLVGLSNGGNSAGAKAIIGCIQSGNEAGYTGSVTTTTVTTSHLTNVDLATLSETCNTNLSPVLTMVKAVSYMGNPSYFGENDFLGTQSGNTFYDFSSTSGFSSQSSATSQIPSQLQSLDLDSITITPPKEVVLQTITIE